MPSWGHDYDEGENNLWYLLVSLKRISLMHCECGVPCCRCKLLWALQLTNQVWGSSRWVHSSNVTAIWVVAEILAGNESANQRPAFSRKSLECDGTLIRSEDCSGEATVPIWKQYDECLRIWWPEINQPIRGQHSSKNHWNSTLTRSQAN